MQEYLIHCFCRKLFYREEVLFYAHIYIKIKEICEGTILICKRTTKHLKSFFEISHQPKMNPISFNWTVVPCLVFQSWILRKNDQGWSREDNCWRTGMIYLESLLTQFFYLYMTGLGTSHDRILGNSINCFCTCTIIVQTHHMIKYDPAKTEEYLGIYLKC